MKNWLFQKMVSAYDVYEEKQNLNINKLRNIFVMAHFNKEVLIEIMCVSMVHKWHIRYFLIFEIIWIVRNMWILRIFQMIQTILICRLIKYLEWSWRNFDYCNSNKDLILLHVIEYRRYHQRLQAGCIQRRPGRISVREWESSISQQTRAAGWR